MSVIKLCQYKLGHSNSSIIIRVEYLINWTFKSEPRELLFMIAPPACVVSV